MENQIVVKEQNHAVYIDTNLQLIANQNKLSGADLQNFAIQCKRTGLDPITRQIYAIPMQGRLTIMASIDGLRLVAERSGAYEGQTAPQWCGEDGVWKDVWLEKTPPKACKVGVYKTKFRDALIAIALFDEYAKKDRYGKLEFMWGKMPALMIAKVAESLALRKAFPNEMSGIFSTEEMDQATQEPIKDAQPVEPPKSFIQKVKDAAPVDKSKIEYDFNSFVISFGRKMAGKKLTDFTVNDHKGMIKYLEDGAAKTGKQIDGPALDYYNIAQAYIKQTKSKR